MTKDEKLGALTEFAKKVIDEAWSDVVTEVSASDILSWARECGLIYAKEVEHTEAAEFDVPPGTSLYMYEKWVEKIAEGLNEALDIACGQKKPAKLHVPPPRPAPPPPVPQRTPQARTSSTRQG